MSEQSDSLGDAEFDAVSRRLRESKVLCDREDRCNGLADGRTWAMRKASYRALRNVQYLIKSGRLDFWDADDPCLAFAAQMAGALGFSTELPGADSLARYRLFGGQTPGQSMSYVHGFICGAMYVWVKVREGEMNVGSQGR